MITILLVWGFAFLITSVVGGGVLNFLNSLLKREIVDTGPFENFWMGLTIVVIFLEFFSLLSPVNFNALIILISTFLIIVLYSRRKYFLWISHFARSLRGKTALVIFIAILVLSICYSASGPVLWYDTNLYHLNAVRWIADYPSIPGLANLHTRLGFNSSFFLYAALSNIGRLSGNASHFALSLLIVVAVIQWLLILISGKSSWQEKALSGLTLPLLLYYGWSQETASLSTDAAMSVITLVFTLELIKRSKYLSPLLLPLASLAFTFKLNGAILLPFAAIFALLKIGQRKENKKVFILSLFISALLILGYFTRNIILSGWILFPVSVGNMNLPWSPAKDQIQKVLDTINAWGRKPGPGYIDALNYKFLDWFMPWINKNRNTLEIRIFTVSFVLLFINYFSSRISRVYKKSQREITVLLGISAGGILFMIFFAPLLRFGLIYFWLFFTASALPLAISLLKSRFEGKVIFFFLILFLIIGVAGYGPPTNIGMNILKVPADVPQPLERKEIKVPEGYSKQYLWVPKDGDLCGNSPIPCTPQWQNVTLRDPGDLSKGFVLINK